MLANPGYLEDAQYHVTASYYCFIMERLFSTYLTMNRSDVKFLGMHVDSSIWIPKTEEAREIYQLVKPLTEYIEQRPDIQAHPSLRSFYDIWHLLVEYP
jgi:hypothetical protein